MKKCIMHYKGLLDYFGKHIKPKIVNQVFVNQMLASNTKGMYTLSIINILCYTTAFVKLEFNTTTGL